jgi:hypothetical protein
MADHQDVLFDVTPTRPPLDPGLSADRKRTIRQAAALAAGRHPLQPVAGRSLPLHTEAAPHDDRTAPGRRCGDCKYRVPLRHHERTHVKCLYGMTGSDVRTAPRASNSAASDVRAWWPACADHQPKEAGAP